MKLYKKKDLRKALDSVFKQYPKAAINREALKQFMFQNLGFPKPEYYRQAEDEVLAYLAGKVEDKYLDHATGMGGGYRRVSDFSSKEWAAMLADRALIIKGNEIKQGVIRSLEAQIESVRAKPVRSFL